MRIVVRLVAVLAVGACGRLRFDSLAAPVGDAPAACPHTFCDDFDRTSVQGPWDSTNLLGGTLDVAGGQLVAGAAADGDRAYLAKSLPVATTGVHLEADVDLAAGTAGEIDLIQIIWHDLPPFCSAGGGFGYFLVRDRLNVVEIQETYVSCGAPGSSNDNLPSFPPDPPSGPHHVTIDITLGAVSPPHLRTQITDLATGMTTVDLDQTITAHPVPASHIDLQMGVPGVQVPTAPWTVRYDNLVVDIN